MNFYDDIFFFSQKLNKENLIQWKDYVGKLDFFINEDENNKQIYNEKDTRYIIANYLNINKQEYKDIKQIISICGFSVHNKGKIEAQKLNVPLITIPIPLSNDSFGQIGVVLKMRMKITPLTKEYIQVNVFSY